MKNDKIIFLLLILLMYIYGCAPSYELDNTPGKPTKYQPVTSPTNVQGLGIEAQDIASVTDRMVRDIINTPALSSRANPPLIIVDDEYFDNRSHSRIDTKLFTSDLRNGLQRSAQGRMYFINRQNIDMIEKERLLKREGVVTSGTGTITPATAGADYRLSGAIMDRIAVSNSSGMTDWTHDVLFELTDLESGIIIWSNKYTFRKTGADDVVYR